MPVSKLSLDFQGMVTAPGKLQAPPGSLTVAQNVNFTAPGVCEKRRGYVRSDYGLVAAWKTYSSATLGDNLLVSCGAGGTSPLYSEATEVRWGDPAAGFTLLPAIDSTAVQAPYSNRARMTSYGLTHYGTSNRACWRVGNDGAGDPNLIYWAGMPRPFGFHGESTTPLTAAAGRFLADGYAVAYRVVWVLPGDEFNPELVSPPSGRYIVPNVATTGGYVAATTANVNLRILIPFQSDTIGQDISAGWKYQIYRTKQFPVTGATATQPDDEMQLVYEANPTAGDITTGYVDIVDTCPDGVMGAYLYTNTSLGGDVGTDVLVPDAPGVAGVLASNDRPPLARDITTFADCAIYGNIQTPHRLLFSIVAVGTAGNVLKNTDALQIASGSLAFTVNASNVASAPGSTNFLVVTTAGSLALNVRATAINLCAAINSHPSNGWLTATYVGNDSNPGTVGQILLEANRSDNPANWSNGTDITVTVTAGSSLPYLPQMPVSSLADVRINGLAISKPGLPDAVPPANYISVGPKDADIVALVPLRDALFIFTDRGVYWMRNETPSTFTIEEFDLTFRLLGKETAVVCQDAIYAWGREGIARITNGGIQFIDLPIRDYVQKAIRGLRGTVGLAKAATEFWTAAYPTERRVLFFFHAGDETLHNGTTPDPYGCSEALVWNIATGGWSTYHLEKKCGRLSGVVRYSDELLYAGEWNAGSTGYFYSEHDAQVATDFADHDRVNSTKAIISKLQWTTAAPDPSAINHWREVQFYFNVNTLIPAYALPTTCTMTMETEFSSGNGQSSSFVPTIEQVRIFVEPKVGMATRCVLGFEHVEKNEYFCLGGWGLIYGPVSTFTTR